MTKSNDQLLKEFLADIDENIVVADGLSHAFIGLTLTEEGTVAVYSTERIIAHLMEQDMMDFDTAEEYMHFNILGAKAPQRNPIYVDVVPEEFWK
jgi:hypothetical protein